MRDSTIRSFDPFPFHNFDESREVVLDMVSKIRHIDCWGWCATEEYIALYEVARGYHDVPGVKGHILEYGTNRGGSAAAMALGVRDSEKLKDAPVFTVDPFYRQHGGDDAHRDSREIFWILELFHDYVCPIVSTSVLVQQFWRLPLRVLFVDSSHGPATLEEIFYSLPLIVDNGWLICHDYGGEWGNFVVESVNGFLDSPMGKMAETYFVEPYTVLMRIRNEAHI